MTSSLDFAVDRNGLEVLDLPTCLELAGSVPVARVAVNAPGSPLVLPVTHVVLGQRVAFRTAQGSKLDAAIMEEPVTIEVDDWDLATRTGWSVLFRGHARPIDDADVEAELAELNHESWVKELWFKPTNTTAWVEVIPDEVSGRRIPAEQ